MKILLLVGGSRAGVDFFHSLIDGHSQILQFPGYLVINENFYRIFNLNDISKIPNEFISQYPHFFNSKKNKVERHHKLGKKRNKFFIVNKKKFTKSFFAFMKNKNSKFDILLALHAAYELAKGKKIKNKKIILVNTHIIDYTNKFIHFMNIKNIEIIHTIRNPLSALSSPIKNWLNYKNGKYFLFDALFYHLDLVYKGLNRLRSLKKKVFVVQLEKLHKENKKVMKDFCRLFKIRFENCLKKSTYHNLEWWGDEISGKFINGINKNFKATYDKSLFFRRDISFFEFLAEDIINNYGYNFSHSLKRKYFFNFFPMKCEIIVWKNILKNRGILIIFLIPYYYLKRLVFINKFSLRKIHFPYSIGAK
tara:strand:- start:23 stop:1114 length:1092 start_codon:yes stop_codon:yes gene_type:complete